MSRGLNKRVAELEKQKFQGQQVSSVIIFCVGESKEEIERRCQKAWDQGARDLILVPEKRKVAP